MLKSIYNQRITILNKLKRVDNNTGTDIWQKTIVEDAAWYRESERDMGNTSVIIGTVNKILIPFHDNFKPYFKWKNSSTRNAQFTMSTGDYIVLGDVTEDINASNIVKTLENYGERVCQVKHHTENYDRYGAKVQLKIEGV